ncbi:GST1, partial [Symbiodinium microadriaticum]
AGKLTYGQLPALEIAEGVFLAQSAAIMRYLGKKNGLYPADDVAAAIVDGVIDEVS